MLYFNSASVFVVLKRLLLASFCLLILSSCKPQLNPKIAEGLKKEFQKLGDDIEVSDINQINGIKKEVDGTKAYQVEFNAKFKVIKAYSVGRQGLKAGPDFPEGEQIYSIEKGLADFIETDNGWECQGVTFEMMDLWDQIPKK